MRIRLFRIYFEGSLKESREQHPFLGRSYPESAASFAAKFAEGAIGKSERKISVKGLQAKWAGILHKHACMQRSKVRIEGYEKAASNEIGQAKLTTALAARRRGTHEKFTAAVDKGTVLTNEEARVAFRYTINFSLKLMEKLPSKCLYADTRWGTDHIFSFVSESTQVRSQLTTTR